MPSPGQRPYGHYLGPVGLEGAESILKLRAFISNGDLDQYWRCYLRKEHERVHHARYRDS